MKTARSPCSLKLSDRSVSLIFRPLRLRCLSKPRPTFARPQDLAAQPLPSPVVHAQSQLPRCEQAGPHPDPDRIIGGEAGRHAPLMEALKEAPVAIDRRVELLDLVRGQVNGVHGPNLYRTIVRKPAQ